MTSWKRFIVALVLNIALTLLVLLIRGFGLKIYYVDAFSVAGSVSILLGMLFWVTAAGAFDALGYGISTFRSMKKYKDFYEYTVRKKEIRSRKEKKFPSFIVVGIVFLMISFLISAV